MVGGCLLEMVEIISRTLHAFSIRNIKILFLPKLHGIQLGTVISSISSITLPPNLVHIITTRSFFPSIMFQQISWSGKSKQWLDIPEVLTRQPTSSIVLDPDEIAASTPAHDDRSFYFPYTRRTNKDDVFGLEG